MNLDELINLLEEVRDEHGGELEVFTANEGEIVEAEGFDDGYCQLTGADPYRY